MRFLEALGVVERVPTPLELKDVTRQDYQQMVALIAAAQFIVEQTPDIDVQLTGVQNPTANVNGWTGLEDERRAA